MASDIDLQPFYPNISDLFPFLPNISDPSSKQPGHSTCGATALQWTGLILAVFAISVSWWLLELPLLWKRRPTSPSFPAAGMGLRVHRFLDSVSWQCLRCHMPSVAALIAMRMTGEPREIALIYYRGPLHPLPDADPEGGGRSPGLSLLQMAVAVVVDLATVVGTAVTIAMTIIDDRGGADSTVSKVTTFNSSGWLSPALPIAIYGLWLLACTATKWSRRWILLGGFLFIVLAGCAIILPLALLDRQVYVSLKDGREYNRGSGLWIFALISYIYMALPLALCRQLAGISLLVAGFSRNGALAITSLGSSPDFPFCELRRGKAFGITFLVFGIVAMIFSIRGLAIFFAKPPPDGRRCWEWCGAARRDGEEIDDNQRWARLQREREIEDGSSSLAMVRLPPGTVPTSPHHTSYNSPIAVTSGTTADGNIATQKYGQKGY